MSTLGEVVAQLHVALAKAGQARQALTAAADLLCEAHGIAEESLASATAKDATTALTSLAQLRQDTTDVDAMVAKAETITRDYLCRISADARESTSPTTTAPPDLTSTREPAPVAGQWHGKNATDLVHDEGRTIGRAPARPRKSPIREVRSTAELNELFAALSAGGREGNVPTYLGDLVVLPDGTTVGYRLKSRTTTEPTIDIRTPARRRLKIHVNTQDWD